MNNPVHRQRIMKCGWLRKQGGMVKTWHRRWFCLNGDCLFYFSREDDLKPLGTIFLPGNRIVEHAFIPDEPDKFLMEIFPDPKKKQLSGTIQPKMAPNHDTFLLWAANADERDGWIKAIRKVMHSPFGGAIFGQALEDTMAFERVRGRHMPYIITHCVEFIREHGMDVEGIFRLAGRKSLMKDLRDKFDCAEKVKFDLSEVDVHTVASLLKLYLRELPDSIIPAKYYQKFMNIALRFQDSRDSTGRMEAVSDAKEAIAEIPLDNYTVLSFLCKFFSDIAEMSEINKMTKLNLATVLGPNVIRNVTEVNTPELLMATADLTQQLAYMMICHNEDIFVRGSEPSSITVDDLLNLGESDGMPSPLSTTAPGISSHMMDLEGIDFIDGDTDSQNQTLSPQSDCSDGISKTKSSVSSTDTADSVEIMTNNDTIDSVSTSNIKAPLPRPIPPKRRSKVASLKRGRRVSDRARDTPPASPSVEPEAKNIAQQLKCLAVESENVNGDDCVFDGLTGDERISVQGSVEGERISKMRAQIRGLNQQIDTLKHMHEKEIVSLKSEHEKELSDLRCQEKALQSQIAMMKTKFEQRLSGIEARNKDDVKKLCEKIATEKVATSEAVKKVMALQAELQQYQSRYGKIGEASN